MGGGGYLGESIQGAIYEQGPSPGEIEGGVNFIGVEEEWERRKKKGLVEGVCHEGCHQ
jgi:hypothetical protein